ncbi:hfsB [Brevundimonas lenta]|uniref:Mrp family chromosome partitioning ATPase n=1 Tax=Brevundimonas lenta TaxID=424796 RepID=A0A7W6JFR0_9CAUL|nr:hfsB [Brevundimonas lenta]MBB4083308.1 Mrp family chromosome partitioning ATPase [Brevundimonas lenta]
MVDLTSEMAALWAALGPAPGHRGRVVQIAAANTGEGVSTVAREYARLAAVRARRPVWLIDADLAQQGQFDAAAAEPERFGGVGKAAMATPDGSIFFAVTPRVLDRQGNPVHPARLITARPFLGGRLWVTRFAGESLRSGQRAEVVGDARYWDVLRRHADTVVIDSPAADRSDTAITLAPFVDATVLVVAAESTAAGEPMILRDEIEAVGGRIAGVVVNRSTYNPPAFLKRLTG